MTKVALKMNKISPKMAKVIHIWSKWWKVRETWLKSYCQPKILLAARLPGFPTFSWSVDTSLLVPGALLTTCNSELTSTQLKPLQTTRLMKAVHSEEIWKYKFLNHLDFQIGHWGFQNGWWDLEQGMPQCLGYSKHLLLNKSFYARFWPHWIFFIVHRFVPALNIVVKNYPSNTWSCYCLLNLVYVCEMCRCSCFYCFTNFDKYKI